MIQFTHVNGKRYEEILRKERFKMVLWGKHGLWKFRAEQLKDSKSWPRSPKCVVQDGFKCGHTDSTLTSPGVTRWKGPFRFLSSQEKVSDANVSASQHSPVVEQKAQAPHRLRLQILKESKHFLQFHCIHLTHTCTCVQTLYNVLSKYV